jgi:glutamine amidotransferase
MKNMLGWLLKYKIMQNIGIVNLGQGNIGSLAKIISSLEANPVIIDMPNQLNYVDKIILPGVGHFSTAMSHMKKSGLNIKLKEISEKADKFILGICLGMQLMADSSEEGETDGLSIIPGHVNKMLITDQSTYKLPIIGWNNMSIVNDHPLLRGINNYDEFYFLHSYFYNVTNNGNIVATTKYENDYTSVISNRKSFGVQFHPEKSHKCGLKLLKNFTLL